MPFGLFNTLASFRGYNNKILAEKLEIFVIIYLDDILIYIKDRGQPHIDAVHWVLEQLRKHSFFANLKKCRFYQDEFHFLRFVILAQRINIEEERIQAVKAWPKPKSIRDIQVFLRFTNFYRRFIQGFNKIITPLTSMLKTTARISSRAADNSSFLTSEAKLAFLRLRQAFTEAPILYHFDLECNIQIETYIQELLAIIEVFKTWR